jgi:hypothetical protein
LQAVKLVEPMPRLHPNLAEVYARKVARLEEALNDPATREDAAEALRSLIDEIRLTPVDGVLAAELYGELGAIMAAGQQPTKNRTAGEAMRFSLVAGTCNHRQFEIEVAV